MIDIVEMTVLIVDDMPNMITTVRGMMKFLNYGKRFIPAGDGEQAWNILKKEPVDLLIMDYNMPIMNGAELLNRIREDRELKDLPVIMISAHASQDYVAEAAESEIDAYILKPATVKMLGDKIVSVIEKANNPSPMVLHLKEARSLEELGDLEGAIGECKLAVDANPQSSRPLRELGYYFFKLGDLQKAKKWLSKAAQMNTLDVFAYHYLGEVFIRQNDMEMASKCFEKAMDISPRHTARAVSFGKTLLERDMTVEAVEVFEKALALSGSDLKIREEIAGHCLDKGAKEYGAKLLEAILRANPKRNDICFRLGITLFELEEYSKALVFLGRIDEAEKENVEAKKYIAKAYMNLKKPIRAEKPLKEILKIDPDNKEAQELLKQCA